MLELPDTYRLARLGAPLQLLSVKVLCETVLLLPVTLTPVHALTLENMRLTVLEAPPIEMPVPLKNTAVLKLSKLLFDPAGILKARPPLLRSRT